MLGVLVYCVGYIIVTAWLLVWYDKNRTGSDLEGMPKEVIYLFGLLSVILLPFMILVAITNKLAEFIKKYTK